VVRIVRAANASAMTADGTRTFVIGRTRPVVVDPGPYEEAHVGGVLAALGGRVPVAILLTHAHADHAAAAEPLARRTGAPVRILPGALSPLPPSPAWLDDGERIETDAGVLRVVATPGHAPEHACFLWTGGPPEHEGTLLAGDMFMGGADTTLVAPPEGSLTDYLRSLERLEALAPRVILPAHGPPLAPGAEAIARYRAHRRDRVEQVVRALVGGPARPRELVPRVYGERLPAELVDAAEGSLRAILDHLRGEGTVLAEARDRYRLADPGNR
jgi:glyoxylase-like metal-dependent hydrolase (beta-lactamase superfamily II)